MIYTLKLFNTGQITLPKNWRDKFKTKNYIAKVTKEGLLIKPIMDDQGVVYYENEKGFGIYSPEGIDPDEIIKAIEKIDGKKNRK